MEKLLLIIFYSRYMTSDKLNRLQHSQFLNDTQLEFKSSSRKKLIYCIRFFEIKFIGEKKFKERHKK